MSRCIYCGAQIIAGTCLCGAQGRKMREATGNDATDAAGAYEKTDQGFFDALRAQHRADDRRDALQMGVEYHGVSVRHGKTLRAKLELEIAIQHWFEANPDTPLLVWSNGAIRTIEPPTRPTPSS